MIPQRKHNKGGTFRKKALVTGELRYVAYCAECLGTRETWDEADELIALARARDLRRAS